MMNTENKSTSRLRQSVSDSNPFVELLGIEVLKVGGGLAEVRLALRPELLNGYGIGHGGVSMTMLDVVMARAARSADPLAKDLSEARPAVTVKLEASFLRPAQPEVLLGYAEVLACDEQKVKTKGWIVNERGKKVAEAFGEFQFLKLSRTEIKS